MGNCWGKSEKSMAEIVPHDGGGRVHPIVRVSGSRTSIHTAYIRFALLYKEVTFDFAPFPQTARFGASECETPVLLQVGSETVSGTKETLLGYIESRLPNPPLRKAGSCEIEGETTPFVVRVTWLQHKSMMWHLDRLVRWADDLKTRGGRKAADPMVGSPKMEIKKFDASYSKLLEVMLEHAQMEERVLFPILDEADRGLCRCAKEEHARDLPIMNGIKEVIKSIGVLDIGSPDYREALLNLSTRLKLLQKQSQQHFMEEDKHLLPYMEATELKREQHERALEECLDVMQGTHSLLFGFLLQGLLPQYAMQYLDLVNKNKDKARIARMIRTIYE